MDDDTHPIGSDPSWEPAPAPGPQDAAASGPPAAAAAADTPAAERTSRSARWRSRFSGTPNRRRGALAGAAVGLVAVSGLGGFALGHATADGGGGRHGDRGPVDARFQDRGGHGFPGGIPPQRSGGAVPGQPPGADGDPDGPGSDRGGDTGSGSNDESGTGAGPGSGTGTGSGSETEPGSRT